MNLEIKYAKNSDGRFEWITQDGKPLEAGYADDNEVYVVDSDGEKKQTKSRFLNYTGKVLRDKDGHLLETDIFKNDTILRFHNGMLDGQGIAAVETATCHMEYWEKGILQQVVTDYMDWKEQWKDNKLINITIDKE